MYQVLINWWNFWNEGHELSIKKEQRKNTRLYIQYFQYIGFVDNNS